MMNTAAKAYQTRTSECRRIVMSHLCMNPVPNVEPGHSLSAISEIAALLLVVVLFLHHENGVPLPQVVVDLLHFQSGIMDALPHILCVVHL